MIPHAINHSPEIDLIATDLAKAQGEMEQAQMTGKAKGLKGNSGEYNYAKIDDLLVVARQALSKNNIAVMQPPIYHVDEVGTEIGVTTMLVHTSGQYFMSSFSMPTTQLTAHALAGLITYARRYSIASFVGIAAGDDEDAQAAQLEQQAEIDIEKEVNKRVKKEVDDARSEGKRASMEHFAMIVPMMLRNKDAIEALNKAAADKDPQAGAVAYVKIPSDDITALTPFNDQWGGCFTQEALDLIKSKSFGEALAVTAPEDEEAA